MATMKASRCRQRATGQGERLIRLTMVLFYGQTISVRYIIRQFDVSPRPQDGTSLNWPLCWNPLDLTAGDWLPR
jgi:hypothetical protein